MFPWPYCHSGLDPGIARTGRSSGSPPCRLRLPVRHTAAVASASGVSGSQLREQLPVHTGFPFHPPYGGTTTRGECNCSTISAACVSAPRTSAALWSAPSLPCRCRGTRGTGSPHTGLAVLFSDTRPPPQSFRRRTPLRPAVRTLGWSVSHRCCRGSAPPRRAPGPSTRSCWRCSARGP